MNTFCCRTEQMIRAGSCISTRPSVLNGSCAQLTARFECLLYLIFFKSGGQIVSSFTSLQPCWSQGNCTSSELHRNEHGQLDWNLLEEDFCLDPSGFRWSLQLLLQDTLHPAESSSQHSRILVSSYNFLFRHVVFRKWKRDWSHSNQHLKVYSSSSLWVSRC